MGQLFLTILIWTLVCVCYGQQWQETQMNVGSQYVRCGNCVCSNKKAVCSNITDEPIKIPSYITNLHINTSHFGNFSSRILPKNVKLTILHIKNSKIDQVLPDMFNDQTNIQTLEIKATKFENITELFPAMKPLKYLKELRLRELELRNMSIQTFSYINTSRITILRLEQNYLTEFDTKVFGVFTSLRTLDLAGNTINRFVGNTSLPSIIDLDLGNNRLGDDPWSLCLSNNISLFENLKRVSLATNAISKFNISKLICLKQLENLIMSGNTMKRLDISMLTPLNKLKELNLGDNWIEYIETGKFPSNLKHIDFSGNDFSVFPPKLCKDAYEQYTNITSLDFSGCSIKRLWIDNWALCLPNLENLDFSDNLVYTSSNESLRGLPKLRVLNLSGNRMKYIDAGLFNSSSLTNLSLQYNWVRFDADSNRNIFKYCPNLTQLNISYNALGTIGFDLLQKILSPLQSLTELNMKGCRFNRMPTDLLSNHSTLKVLNMEKNYLAEIYFPTNFSVGLEKISVADNKIQLVRETSFPPKLMKSLKSLNLKWNAFSCECAMRWFRNQINESGYFGSVKLEGWPDGYDCRSAIKSDHSFEHFKDFHLSEDDCKPFDNSLVAYIAMGAVMFVIVVVAVVGYWNRWYVQFYWHNTRKRCTRQTDEESNLNGLLYDAYVVYHQDDSTFVNGEFIDRFETMLRYNAHIWDRNADFGAKVDVMLDAMDACRVVIVIVSNALLNWSWGMFQVDVAIAKSIEDKRKHVFFVLLEDINRASLSKSWCVMLTKMPGVPWCNDPGNIKSKLFDEEVRNILKAPLPRNPSNYGSIENVLQNDSIAIEWRESELEDTRAQGVATRFAENSETEPLINGMCDEHDLPVKELSNGVKNDKGDFQLRDDQIPEGCVNGGFRVCQSNTNVSENEILAGFTDDDWKGFDYLSREEEDLDIIAQKDKESLSDENVSPILRPKNESLVESQRVDSGFLERDMNENLPNISHPVHEIQ